MLKNPEIFQKLFPHNKLPPTLLNILSRISFSELDLLKASPSKLTPPFSLPGMRELIEELNRNLSQGVTIHLQRGDSGDSIVARALFSAIFKKYHRQILTITDTGQTIYPLLDLSNAEGIRYLKTEKTPSIFLPSSCDSSQYSITGLVFKLGQAKQLSEEKNFGKQYVSFDLETTGKNHRSDEIIEIGAVKIKDGEPGEEFNALVKPSHPISSEITDLTGITNDDVKDSPPIQDVLPSFMDFIEDSVLVAHNVDFDYPFLSHALKKSLGRTLNNDSYCTLVQARARMPGQSHRLGAVAEALGIELKNWHRASADAKAAALIFRHFMEEDNSSRRYAYFQKYAARACLGTLASGLPLSKDNAIFFRYGLPEILFAFTDGEKYFQKHTEKKQAGDDVLVKYLNSWRRKKRARAVYRIIATKTLRHKDKI
jgi:DNA polymerase III epsilon subunit family exonuclease